MLLHLPIVIAATLSPVAVSDTVPKFDIVKECQFEGGSTTEIDRCSDDESAALQQLEKEWAQFVGSDRRNCMATATTAGVASYVEPLICLEMARDINNASRGPRDSQSTDATRLRAPGVTVGVGRGWITEGPMSGRGSR